MRQRKRFDREVPNRKQSWKFFNLRSKNSGQKQAGNHFLASEGSGCLGSQPGGQAPSCSATARGEMGLDVSARTEFVVATQTRSVTSATMGSFVTAVMGSLVTLRSDPPGPTPPASFVTGEMGSDVSARTEFVVATQTRSVTSATMGLFVTAVMGSLATPRSDPPGPASSFVPAGLGLLGAGPVRRECGRGHAFLASDLGPGVFRFFGTGEWRRHGLVTSR